MKVNNRLVVECVAGLLGWLACYSGDGRIFASFNQAPQARSFLFFGVPSIWVFTRFTQGVPAAGTLVQCPTMSDFLVHYGNGKVRELIEVHAGKLYRRQVPYHSGELLVQTNRYRVAPRTIRKINPSFDDDSRRREAAVRRAYAKTGEIHSMLYAAEDDEATIDHFVMNPD